jgi:hypothetical protein
MLARFLGHFNVSILKNLLISRCAERVKFKPGYPIFSTMSRNLASPLPPEYVVEREAPREPDRCGSLQPFLVSALSES